MLAVMRLPTALLLLCRLRIVMPDGKKNGIEIAIVIVTETEIDVLTVTIEGTTGGTAIEKGIIEIEIETVIIATEIGNIEIGTGIEIGIAVQSLFEILTEAKAVDP